MRVQPSELTKITLVMILAAYYDWLDLSKKIATALRADPAGDHRGARFFLTLREPDLGTALLLLMGGGAVMFVPASTWA